MRVVAAKVPEEGFCRVRGGGGVAGVEGVCAGLAGHDGVDVGEADVVAVEAVCLVYQLEAVVVWLDEGDVDALNFFSGR